jgi:SAM-dependent methyltransferase
MVSLHLQGHETPLSRTEARRLLRERRTLWVWVSDDDGCPFVRPNDDLELTREAPTRAGLALVDRGGEATLALVRDPSEAELIGWVRQIGRGAQRYRLDRPPWPYLFRLPGREVAWLWTARLFHATSLVRHLAGQWRPAPDVRAIEARERRIYAEPLEAEFYREETHAGLDGDEEYLVERYLRPGHAVLDVGCGTGREALDFARRGLRVTGIDLSTAFVEHARRAAAVLPPGCEPSFAVMPLSELAFPPSTFDAVYLSCDLYNRIPGQRNRIAALERCGRVLRPEGLLLVSIHLYPEHSRRERLFVEAPRRAARRLLGSRVPEEGDRWIATGPEPSAPRAFKHFFYTEAEARAEIEAAGFAVLEHVSSSFVARALPRPEAATGSPGAGGRQAGEERFRPRIGRRRGVVTSADGDGGEAFWPRSGQRAGRGTTVVPVPGREQRAGRGPTDRLSRFRCPEDVTAEAVGSELLLVHLAQGTTFRLNATGKAIWELAITGLSAAEVAERLQPRLGVPMPRLRQDAGALLEELVRNALLAREPEAVA